VVASAFAALSPGSYFEMQDSIMPFQYVGEIPINSSLYKWNTHLMAAAELAKRPWTNVKNYPSYFHRAGFEDIVTKNFCWPTNSWPKGNYLKALSKIFQEDLLINLEGFSMKLFTSFLGWEKEKVEEFLVGVKADLKNRKICAYLQITVIYGRKPL